jgi:hypothetical protein
MEKIKKRAINMQVKKIDKNASKLENILNKRN